MSHSTRNGPWGSLVSRQADRCRGDPHGQEVTEILFRGMSTAPWVWGRPIAHGIGAGLWGALPCL